MKKAGIIFFIALIGFVGSSFVNTTTTVQDNEEALTWHTDLGKVHDISQKTGKPVFGFFTGSDWCGWCHKLQREVFAKPAFIKWANENVVLLELDFPRKTQLPAELAQQNRNLQQAFNVSGYPTVWIFNTEKDAEANYNLKALGKLGYPSGAVKGKEEDKFIATANGILANDK